MNPETPVIEIAQLARKYGRTDAVNGLSLRVEHHLLVPRGVIPKTWPAIPSRSRASLIVVVEKALNCSTWASIRYSSVSSSRSATSLLYSFRRPGGC